MKREDQTEGTVPASQLIILVSFFSSAYRQAAMANGESLIAGKLREDALESRSHVFYNGCLGLRIHGLLNIHWGLDLSQR